MGMGAMGMGAMAGGAAVQGGAALAGGFVNAGAQSAQGTYSAAMYKINAGLAGKQATDATARGDFAAEGAIGKARALQGAQQASAASQGVDAGTGSAVRAQSDAAGIGAMDALTIKNNAYRQAFGYEAQAIQANASGEFAQEAGSNAAASSILTGGMGFLSAGLKGASYMSGGYANPTTANGYTMSNNY